MNLIGFRALGVAQYATLNVVKKLTDAPTTGAAMPTGNNQAGAALVLLQVTGQNVRWHDDDTDPTASVGMILYVGADPYPYSGDLARLRFLESSASAVLNVSYYGAV